VLDWADDPMAHLARLEHNRVSATRPVAADLEELRSVEGMFDGMFDLDSQVECCPPVADL